jgi:hypothetical protein
MKYRLINPFSFINSNLLILGKEISFIEPSVRNPPLGTNALESNETRAICQAGTLRQMNYRLKSEESK